MHKLKCETTYAESYTMVGTLTIYSSKTPIIVTPIVVNYLSERFTHITSVTANTADCFTTEQFPKVYHNSVCYCSLHNQLFGTTFY